MTSMLEFAILQLYIWYSHSVRLAGLRNEPVFHVDIANAYLFGTLEETLYMEQPKGFEDRAKPLAVCRLKKSLYDLKKSACRWQLKFKTVLESIGFKALNYAESAYISTGPGPRIVILTYVDDCVIWTTDIYAKNEVVRQLSKEFELTDLGEISKFLGVQISKNSDGKYSLCQRRYIEVLLDRFKMQDCNPAVTPMDPGALKTLTVEHGPLLKNEIPLDAPYREIIGALLYLSTHTRPDIAVAVNILSRHVSNPRECHWEASKRI